jgi:hypothetical protein
MRVHDRIGSKQPRFLQQPGGANRLDGEPGVLASTGQPARTKRGLSGQLGGSLERPARRFEAATTLGASRSPFQLLYDRLVRSDGCQRQVPSSPVGIVLADQHVAECPMRLTTLSIGARLIDR